jgi:hypothetical protein
MQFYTEASKKMQEFSLQNPTLNTYQKQQVRRQNSMLSDKVKQHGGDKDWKLKMDEDNSGLWKVVTTHPDPNWKQAPLNTTSTKDLVRFIRNAYQHRDCDKIKVFLLYF